MNTPNDPSEFERRLADIPVRKLPAEYRRDILLNACPSLTEHRSFWSSAPRPVLIGIAACWIIIAGLQISMPSPSDNRMPSLSEQSDDELTQALITWVEQRRYTITRL